MQEKPRMREQPGDTAAKGEEAQAVQAIDHLPVGSRADSVPEIKWSLENEKTETKTSVSAVGAAVAFADRFSLWDGWLRSEEGKRKGKKNGRRR